jgi:hypothetical protein
MGGQAELSRGTVDSRDSRGVWIHRVFSYVCRSGTMYCGRESRNR